MRRGSREDRRAPATAEHPRCGTMGQLAAVRWRRRHLPLHLQGPRRLHLHRAQALEQVSRSRVIPAESVRPAGSLPDACPWYSRRHPGQVESPPEALSACASNPNSMGRPGCRRHRPWGGYAYLTPRPATQVDQLASASGRAGWYRFLGLPILAQHQLPSWSALVNS